MTGPINRINHRTKELFISTGKKRKRRLSNRSVNCSAVCSIFARALAPWNQTKNDKKDIEISIPSERIRRNNANRNGGFGPVESNSIEIGKLAIIPTHKITAHNAKKETYFRIMLNIPLMWVCRICDRDQNAL